jgi:outer membrane lipopolysaccharide assembly protein LptE/RlpB
MKMHGSKFKIEKKLICLLLTAYCLLLTICGCGYTMHGKSSLPFDSIQIGTIENTTVEPKLQDKLYQSLTEEFIKQGIRVSPDANYKLEGTINLFDLRILSEKNGIATEYEVIISGDFQLTMPSGDVQDLKGIGSPFIVSFQSQDLLEDVIANKERASEKAIGDMAMEIVGNLIYR